MSDEIEKQSDAGALVSQGEALYRAENDAMLRVAVERPRVEERVLAGALKELEMVPEEAPSLYYSIPYKDHATGQTQLVEGPSIKAALTLSRRWGNCSITARILSEDATGFTVTGIFVDYETMVRVERPMRVSRFIKRRDGRIQELDVKRLEMAVQAGASKAMRNAALSGLPSYLVNTFFKRAKSITAGGKLDETADQAAVSKVVAAFAKLTVTPEQLEAKLELSRNQWTGEDIGTLRGLWTAIKDGEVKVEEEFPHASPAPAPNAPPPAPPSKLDALTDRLTPDRQPMAAPTVVSPARPSGPAPAPQRPADPAPAVGEESEQSKTARGFLMAGIRIARKQIKPALSEEDWLTLTMKVCGTTELEAVSISSLDELCTLLQGLAEKDSDAIQRKAALLA